MDILFIADDNFTKDLLTRLLDPRQAKIHHALNKQDGLLLARQMDASLLILDDSSCSSETVAFCKALRLQTPAPLLVLSAHDDPIRIAAILDAGADRYLVKPVAGSILMANIDTLLRRCQPSQPLPPAWKNQVSVL